MCSDVRSAGAASGTVRVLMQHGAARSVVSDAASGAVSCAVKSTVCGAVPWAVKRHVQCGVMCSEQ